jgi:hypothetical protein
MISIMEESWIDPALDDLGATGGSTPDIRQAGDDAVEALDKIIAQMAGGEHRPEEQAPTALVAGQGAVLKVIDASPRHFRRARPS